MKVLNLILILIILSSTACSLKEPKSLSHKEKTVNRILNECAKTLSSRHDMHCMGDGAAMMYEVKDLFLAFQIFRQITKEEAREILIDAAHEMIQTVNADSEIQPYLLPEKFTKKSVQVHLYINPSKKRTYHPNLGVCSYDFGSLTYSSHDPKRNYAYIRDERETYEEAVAELTLN